MSSSSHNNPSVPDIEQLIKPLLDALQKAGRAVGVEELDKCFLGKRKTAPNVANFLNMGSG